MIPSFFAPEKGDDRHTSCASAASAGPKSAPAAPAVGGSSLAYRACEGGADLVHVVEVENPDPTEAGAAAGYGHGTGVDFVCPEPRQLPGERHLDVEIVTVECFDVGRGQLACDHPGHCRLLFVSDTPTDDATDANGSRFIREYAA